jgi:hypothetical protein
MVVVLLVALWIISTLNAKIRVLENRLDSVEGALGEHDEALELLSPMHAREALPAESTVDAMGQLGPHD